MNYCSNCGQPVSLAIPEGDERERYVCPSCKTIHYQNPRVITGCLPLYKDGDEELVMLCKRGIEPRYGAWTLPAGFMENGETAEQGAARECLEESCAQVDIGPLYTMTSIPHLEQVHLFFRATMATPEFAITPESTDIKLFREEEIPWDEIAFTSVRITLERYFNDRANNRYPVHSGWAGPDESGQWQWNGHWHSIN